MLAEIPSQLVRKELVVTAQRPADGESEASSVADPSETTSLIDGVGIAVLFDNTNGSGLGRIDILFVHGLLGSRQGTWSKDGVFWPRDLLINDMSNVRVITWVYDTSTNSLLDVFDHAHNLLNALDHVRTGARRERYVCPRHLNIILAFGRAGYDLGEDHILRR